MSKFNLIKYDGINLFRNGEWTGLEVESVQIGKEIIGFLETLNEEQVEHWIRLQKYMKGSYNTWNALTSKEKYSGRTTCIQHKHGDWSQTPGAGDDCISAKNVFEIQWTNCPIEIEDEIRTLWNDMEFGNDFYYYQWTNQEDQDQYPKIAAYLKGRGITDCLIHWWW